MSSAERERSPRRGSRRRHRGARTVVLVSSGYRVTLERRQDPRREEPEREGEPEHNRSRPAAAALDVGEQGAVEHPGEAEHVRPGALGRRPPTLHRPRRLRRERPPREPHDERAGLVDCVALAAHVVDEGIPVEADVAGEAGSRRRATPSGAPRDVAPQRTERRRDEHGDQRRRPTIVGGTPTSVAARPDPTCGERRALRRAARRRRARPPARRLRRVARARVPRRRARTPSRRGRSRSRARRPPAAAHGHRARAR